eukprot:CAMPEP_0182847600 /NCGR_PEP_ID=MMETSP0006_2-20121128/28546_1 /TAXON_ID=97485 /ORGANISM="Prymnesium parvum, Strain Texoma1" /LENGTH=248 /DNA_ID=CAMNT_0024977947 /DNA_START=18 /DNA_END=764 /DNA_ORIENTATION=+
MGMKTRQYTAAQVVESALGTLQVRGVDRDLLGKTQLTKLAYVSNAPFQSEEVSDLIFRLRKEHVLNLPVAKVLQMIEMKKRIQEDPLYKYVRHQVHGSHSSEAITAQALPVATATSVQHAVQAVHPLAGGMMRAIPALDPYLPSYGAARLRQGWTPPTMGHFQPARPHVMPVHAQALQTRENEMRASPLLRRKSEVLLKGCMRMKVCMAPCQAPHAQFPYTNTEALLSVERNPRIDYDLSALASSCYS